MVGDELDYLYDLNQQDAELFRNTGVELLFHACEWEKGGRRGATLRKKGEKGTLPFRGLIPAYIL